MGFKAKKVNDQPALQAVCKEVVPVELGVQGGKIVPPIIGKWINHKIKIPVWIEIVACALPFFFLLCDVPSTEFSCDFNRFSFPVIAGTTALQSAGGRSKKVGVQTGNKTAAYAPPD